MKTVNLDEIINDYGCPEIPYNEMVTMDYQAIINAMREACNQAIELAAEEVEQYETQQILNLKKQII